MHITELARRAGLPPRTVRFYVDARLVTPAARSLGGYREFDEGTLRVLRFIGRLKALGLTLAEIRPLVRAAERGNASLALRATLERQLGAVDRQLADLTAVAHELRALVFAREAACRDDLCICRCRTTSRGATPRNGARLPTA